MICDLADPILSKLEEKLLLYVTMWPHLIEFSLIQQLLLMAVKVPMQLKATKCSYGVQKETPSNKSRHYWTTMDTMLKYSIQPILHDSAYPSHYTFLFQENDLNLHLQNGNQTFTFLVFVSRFVFAFSNLSLSINVFIIDYIHMHIPMLVLYL